MNVRILDKLCCPTCRIELALHSFLEESIEYLRYESTLDGSKNTEEKSVERIIKEGVLLCQNCKVWYPVYSYVPVMLVFKTHFHEQFAKEHTEQLRLFSGYKMPNGSPRPGETSVQETFTNEWNCVQDSELAFRYSLEDLKGLNRKVWLKGVENSREEIKIALNVGCGLAYEALALQEVMNNAEMFAIDLNFAILRCGELYKPRQRLHFVIASLFDLPFKVSSFDLVYSHGVIHHTFSTFKAFKSIASYVRTGGYLHIWVYGLDDHLVRRGALGLLARLQFMIEAVLRPLVSRSPKMLRDMFFSTLTFMWHPMIKTRVFHKKIWKLKDTNHSLRDWLSPRYAHRQSYNEVLEWFEELGFGIADVQSPAAYRRLLQKRLWGVGVTGKRCNGQRF